jgi:hypothetical protein
MSVRRVSSPIRKAPSKDNYGHRDDDEGEDLNIIHGFSPLRT